MTVMHVKMKTVKWLLKTEMSRGDRRMYVGNRLITTRLIIKHSHVWITVLYISIVKGNKDSVFAHISSHYTRPDFSIRDIYISNLSDISRTVLPTLTNSITECQPFCGTLPDLSSTNTRSTCAVVLYLW